MEVSIPLSVPLRNKKTKRKVGMNEKLQSSKILRTKTQTKNTKAKRSEIFIARADILQMSV